jgi:hypothetical protein
MLRLSLFVGRQEAAYAGLAFGLQICFKYYQHQLN